MTGGSSFGDDPPPGAAGLQLVEGPADAADARTFADEIRAFLASDDARRLVGAIVADKVPVAEVEDLVQDVLEHATRAVDQSPPKNVEAIPGWTAVIAHHRLADHVRKRARRAKYEGPMPEALADGEPGYVQASHDPFAEPDDFTERAMSWLHGQVADSPLDRETLAMILERYRDRKTYGQIAEERGLPLSTVSSRVFLFKTKYGPRYRRHRATRFAVIAVALATLAFAVFWVLPDMLRDKGAHAPPHAPTAPAPPAR